MRYRRLSDSGDYVFGQGPGEFLINSPAAVAQAIKTRLGTQLGEIFWAINDGMPWFTQIVGLTQQQNRDLIVQNYILATQGVNGIVSWSSSISPGRVYSFSAEVDTIYGTTTVSG